MLNHVGEKLSERSGLNFTQRADSGKGRRWERAFVLRKAHGNEHCCFIQQNEEP